MEGKRAWKVVIRAYVWSFESVLRGPDDGRDVGGRRRPDGAPYAYARQDRPGVVTAARKSSPAGCPSGVARGGHRTEAGGEGAGAAPLHPQQGGADLQLRRHDPPGRPAAR